jgi:hypothetical protein
MGIKKKCRELNLIKNKFILWLKQNNADNIDIFEGTENIEQGWDYYRCVSAFINDNLYVVYFMMWYDNIKIDYNDSENNYKDMDIEEFLQLISELK